MASAKDIELRVIPANVAVPFIRKYHYSGKVVNNSKLHFGAFLNGRLHGVMSFGPPLDKSKVIGLVDGTSWDGMLELNRMAFDSVLPRNSESRCIAIACRLIHKQAPQVKWILSFADACECGDGTIYRAAGFILTDIKHNNQIMRLPNGQTRHVVTLQNQRNKPFPELGGKSLQAMGCVGANGMNRYRELTGAVIEDGFMLRYIKFLDPSWRDHLTVPELPYSAIGEVGAGMYKGQRKG